MTAAGVYGLSEAEGALRREARRRANEQTAGTTTKAEHDLVELCCECARETCEGSIRMPLYVYRRVLEAGNQYVLKPGHHAFARYHTIVTTSHGTIEQHREGEE